MSAPELLDAAPVPVTVLLDPAQAVRLEALIGLIRGVAPAIDDNEVADAIFALGLEVAETDLREIDEPAL